MLSIKKKDSAPALIQHIDTGGRGGEWGLATWEDITKFPGNKQEHLCCVKLGKTTTTTTIVVYNTKTGLLPDYGSINR